MTDISEPALEKAIAKAKEFAPSAVGKVETTKVDVSKESDIEAVVAKLDAWGGVDIMFNNAGIMHADDAGMPLSSFLTSLQYVMENRILIYSSCQMPSTHQRRSGI